MLALGDMTPQKWNVFSSFFSNLNPLFLNFTFNVEVRKKMQSSSLKKSWYCFIAWLPTWNEETKLVHGFHSDHMCTENPAFIMPSMIEKQHEHKYLFWAQYLPLLIWR